MEIIAKKLESKNPTVTVDGNVAVFLIFVVLLCS